MERKDEGRITPEKARALLSENGIEVDAEQAKMILDFLYGMAEIAVDVYFSQEKA